MHVAHVEERKHTIQRLNDKFRRTFIGGIVSVTPAVDALHPSKQEDIFDLVQMYCLFDENNDPHGEHDYGSFTYEGIRYAFKIDYYDKHMRGHSPDPASPRHTTRVMTIMTVMEY